MSDTTNNQSLRRHLKTRHLTMIALGGSIGTGLFLASGGAVAQAGPGGALLAYAAVGIMVYFLMTSLGELATYMPESGSFSTYASRFVDPALGFALGWNFWFNWAITIASELVAATLIIKYWFPESNSILWSMLFLGVILVLNLASVKGYGESEYWFAIIKIATVLIFLATGLFMIFGILGGDRVGFIGFENFTTEEAPFSGGLLALLGVFMAAGYSFQGTELVGIAAGESDNPRESVPKAIRQIFWRILLFYILAIFVIAMLIPYTDPRLLMGNVTDISVSPFTLVFEKAGIAFAASVMNAVILTSVLSAGNSGMYASARILWVLAKEGKAPRFLAKLSKRGVPVNAILLTGSIGMLAFLASLFGDGAVYLWLLSASGMCGFIAWLGIAVSHYRFRRAYVKQGRKLDDLAYRARWFPFGPLFAFVLCMIVIIGQALPILVSGDYHWLDIVMPYIGLPLFLALWFGYKIKHKTKVIPLEQCQLDSEE